MKTASAKASNMIKKILKRKFPETKFSCTSDNYNMGSSVNVSWTDGPTSEQVDKLINEFQYGHFDGMIDLYEYSNSRDDIPQAKYVMSNRRLSDEIVLQASKVAKKHYSDLQDVPEPTLETLGDSFSVFDQYYNWYQLACRILGKIDLTGAKGIKEDYEFTGGGIWEGFIADKSKEVTV